MAVKMDTKDSLPQFFCYECSAVMHKFHTFKEKCYYGQRLLSKLISDGPLTYDKVCLMKRKDILKPILQLIAANTKVKTYCFQDETEKVKNEIEFISQNFKQLEKHPNAATLTNDSNKPYDIIVEIIKDINNLDTNKQINDVLIDDHVFSDNQNDLNNDSSSEDDIPLNVRRIQNKKVNKTQTDTTNKGGKYKFTKTQRVIDPEKWKKHALTDEEAAKQFMEKSQNKQYLSAGFKCTDCYKGFSKEEMLKRHNLLRHDTSIGQFECRFCKMRFKYSNRLRTHMRTHYVKYECLICNMICTLETMVFVHEDYHNGVIKKCKHCGEEFLHKSTYYTHLRTHRSEHVCHLCGSSFVSALGLNNHKRLKHVIQIEEREATNTFCSLCNITFETRKAYEEHFAHSALHTEEVPQDTSPKIDVSRSKQNKVTYDFKRTKRENEDKSSNTRRRYRIMRKVDKKPTTCYQCGEHFETQTACMKHHQTAHPRTSFFAPNQRHICEVCGVSLAPGSVSLHENIHSRSKLFSCETCGRSFNSKVGLTRHLVTHTGEKPYACTLCEKRFTQRGSMKLHYRTFHLKQPYPKRNRRKAIDQPDTREQTSEDSNSAHNTAIVRNPPNVPRILDENIHYFTLT